MVAAVVVFGGTVLFFFDPARNGFYPGCLLYKTTGLLCPGCGGLRAVHQLLHGHLLTAFRFNPIFVLALPLLLAIAVRWYWRRRHPVPGARLVHPMLLWLALALALFFAVWRNLPGSPWALPG